MCVCVKAGGGGGGGGGESGWRGKREWELDQASDIFGIVCLFECHSNHLNSFGISCIREHIYKLFKRQLTPAQKSQHNKEINFSFFLSLKLM